MRARRFAALDLAHLIEGILEAGDMQREAVLSNARVVIEHLLKLAHSPAHDPRNGWRATIREHRARLELGFTPTMRQAVARRAAYPLPVHARPAHRRLVAVKIAA